MDELPNIQNTWAPLGLDVPTFDGWRAETDISTDSNKTAVLLYLDHLWRHHHRGAVTTLNSLGGQDLAKEAAYAYFALLLGNDDGPARRLLRGERLSPGLHPEYVTATRCYG